MPPHYLGDLMQIRMEKSAPSNFKLSTKQPPERVVLALNRLSRKLISVGTRKFNSRSAGAQVSDRILYQRIPRNSSVSSYTVTVALGSISKGALAAAAVLRPECVVLEFNLPESSFGVKIIMPECATDGIGISVRFRNNREPSDSKLSMCWLETESACSSWSRFRTSATFGFCLSSRSIPSVTSQEGFAPWVT